MRMRDFDFIGNYMGYEKRCLHPDLVTETTPRPLCVQLFGETMSRHSETLLATPEPGSEEEKLHHRLHEILREMLTKTPSDIKTGE